MKAKASTKTKMKKSTRKMKKSTTTPRTARSKKKPTSFLSLPREIRQKIFIQSYGRFLFVKPPLFTGSLRETFRTTVNMVNKRMCDHEKQAIEIWVDEMRTVHPIIRDDMDFVGKQIVRRADFGRLMEETQDGENSIGFCNGD
ncbi:hypothetical protein EG328_001356 [Venturia inaequalis]|uniref:Uncharacterized protein n=1 Tax=Venturia inaequalis TaxID=5025 RepID=A0A8H3YYM7_VENIN|nr:hypothetical protein EG328_001356 [Venturia inaequalis]